jgi:hypothetical protein
MLATVLSGPAARAVTPPVHNLRMEPGRIVAVIGTCSAGSCVRPAVLYVEVLSARGRVSGTVCERCAEATSAARFLLDMITARNGPLVAAPPRRAPPAQVRLEPVSI